jgi:preprotein translocase subunit SecD
MIGIAASLFSAFVVTRVIFDMLVSKGNKINIG